MNRRTSIYVFGEVLVDCFSTGEQILGGAPFNVAWHLQALGASPRLISRVGKDQQGDRILQAIQNWNLNTADVQIDPEHPTGRVEVTITDHEPSYDIVPNSAFDFISARQLVGTLANGFLYHGTLCLRNEASRCALHEIARGHNLKIFLDVNLRTPWWQRDNVCDWLKNATWAKMNLDELTLLSPGVSGVRDQMTALQDTYGFEQLIVTRGEQGALIRTASGQFHSRVPEKSEVLVDTVGAGDAFSAIYLHGLMAGWEIGKILLCAQRFASKILTVRGATANDSDFYQQFIDSLEP